MATFNRSHIHNNGSFSISQKQSLMKTLDSLTTSPGKVYPSGSYSVAALDEGSATAGQVATAVNTIIAALQDVGILSA